MVHDSEVTFLIWFVLLLAVTQFAPSPYPTGAPPLIRAITSTRGASHRPTFQNSRSTRRERRNQPGNPVSLIL